MSEPLRVSKHHGLGNDFLVALDETHDAPLEVDSDLAIRLCERRTGIGADGLIHGRPIDGADIEMRLFNSDGSRAEMSGNGIRCLAQAVADARGDSSAAYVIQTGGGPRAVTLRPGARRNEIEASVDMGPVSDGPLLPVGVSAVAPGKVATAAVGNRHLVLLVDDPWGLDLSVEGPAYEAFFDDDQSVNIEFVRTLDADTIELTVWERGSGITQACGTGACAAAHTVHRWGLVGDSVKVVMPGGTAGVELGETALLTGPSVHIATADWFGD